MKRISGTVPAIGIAILLVGRFRVSRPETGLWPTRQEDF